MVPIGAEPHYGILVIASLSAVGLRGVEVGMFRVSDGGAAAAYYAGVRTPRDAGAFRSLTGGFPLREPLLGRRTTRPEGSLATIGPALPPAVAATPRAVSGGDRVDDLRMDVWREKGGREAQVRQRHGLLDRCARVVCRGCYGTQAMAECSRRTQATDAGLGPRSDPARKGRCTAAVHPRPRPRRQPLRAF